MDGVVEDIVKDLLIEDLSNIQYVDELMTLLKGKKRKFYQSLLNVVDYLSMRDCSYKMNDLLEMGSKHLLYPFLRELLQFNSAERLAKINIQNLYRLLYPVQEHHSEFPKYYSKDFINIVLDLS